jgi:hypothetical protein
MQPVANYITIHKAAMVDFWQARQPHWQAHHWLPQHSISQKSKQDSCLACLTSRGGPDTESNGFVYFFKIQLNLLCTKRCKCVDVSKRTLL